MLALSKSLKIINVFIMLAVIIALSIFFGLIGFLIGIVLTVIVSNIHSKHEKSVLEKQRHEEMLKAIKDGKA